MTFEQRLGGHEGIRHRDEMGNASKAGRTGRSKQLRLECQDGSEQCQGRLERGWIRGSEGDKSR